MPKAKKKVKTKIKPIIYKDWEVEEHKKIADNLLQMPYQVISVKFFFDKKQPFWVARIMVHPDKPSKRIYFVQDNKGQWKGELISNNHKKKIVIKWIKANNQFRWFKNAKRYRGNKRNWAKQHNFKPPASNNPR